MREHIDMMRALLANATAAIAAPYFLLAVADAEGGEPTSSIANACTPTSSIINCAFDGLAGLIGADGYGNRVLRHVRDCVFVHQCSKPLAPANFIRL